MKTWIPFFGILLNLNLFFAAAVTGQDILVAIEYNDLAVIQGFIEAGVNFNQSVTDAYSPLKYAMERGRIEIARAILADPGTDINYPTRLGGSPIYYAAYKGHDEMIRLLLADERCARNQVGISEKTPLQLAAVLGHTSTVQALLEDPTVDRNFVSTRDKTALDYAIEKDHFDTAVVLLNDPYVVKDRIDINGKTILHKIAVKDFEDYFHRADRLRILEAILSVGAIDLNHRDLEGKTALHYAVELGDPEMILRLTAAGADSAILDVTGQNAVEYAERREPALDAKYVDALYYVFDCSNVGLK